MKLSYLLSFVFALGLMTACQSRPLVLSPLTKLPVEPSIRTEVTETLPGEPSETVRLKATDIYFDLSSSRLTQEGRTRLLKLNQILVSRPDLYEKLEVVGYADATGPRRLNKQLSQGRALSVAEVMREAGLAPIPVGEASPLTSAPPDSPERRKVEIYLTGVRDEAAVAEILKDVSTKRL